MKKGILFSAALSLAIGISATPAVAATYAQDKEMDTAAVVASRPDGQTLVESPAVPSTETNTIEESATARKMTQAQKAQNAKENDSWGGAITLIAMSVVICALIVLAVLFMIFGKISATIMSRKKRESHGVSLHEAEDHHTDVDSGETIAAIAAALAEHFDTSSHDLERTILTLRRMKRAYSPWNSKIYNMRELPELHKNAPRKLS